MDDSTRESDGVTDPYLDSRSELDKLIKNRNRLLVLTAICGIDAVLKWNGMFTIGFVPIWLTAVTAIAAAVGAGYYALLAEQHN